MRVLLLAAEMKLDVAASIGIDNSRYAVVIGRAIWRQWARVVTDRLNAVMVATEGS